VSWQCTHLDNNVIISQANGEECVPRTSVCSENCRTTKCDITKRKTLIHRMSSKEPERHKSSQDQVGKVHYVLISAETDMKIRNTAESLMLQKVVRSNVG
jgi:hypothetical protein